MVFVFPVDQTSAGAGESVIIFEIGILASYEACTKGDRMIKGKMNNIMAFDVYFDYI